MSLLIYSPRCSHSIDLIDYIKRQPQLAQLVSYHNVNVKGIPPQYAHKITRVPTMLTKNGKFLVGNEIKNWLESLLPNQDIGTCGFGACSMTTLDGESNSDIFGLDDYGRTLQPPMTPELEEKINRDVSQSYNNNIKK
tara:strand:+ start:2604 stop:3017 length:414 start_codon:yes stop_codon:yes gene_type:complete